MKITFLMEQMIEQAPNHMLHNMTHTEYMRYMALNKKKSEMIEEIKVLMHNDEDL